VPRKKWKLTAAAGYSRLLCGRHGLDHSLNWRCVERALKGLSRTRACKSC
jgi:hypothetical protein